MDTLYHYCTNDTFLKIVTGHSIHLSSLSISNDRMEGRLVIDLMKQWALDNIESESNRREFLELVESINSRYDGLGFCLSVDGNVLSQWRGYADDGSGVAIGFSKQHLDLLANKHLPGTFPEIKLHRVRYDINEQHKILQPICNKLSKRINEGAFAGEGLKPIEPTGDSCNIDEETAGTFFEDPLLDLFGNIHSLAEVMYALKTDGFSEEKEWRMIAPYLIHERQAECSFRMGNHGIIPYCEVTLAEGGDDVRIHEVILGPKNPTPIHVIEGVLEANGFTNTKVRGSGLSYR